MRIKKAILNTSIALGCLGLVACGGSSDTDTTTDDTTTDTSVDTTISSVGSISWNFDDDTLQGWSVLSSFGTALWHLSSVRAVSPSNSLRYADPATDDFATGLLTTGVVVSPELTLGAAPTLSLDYFLANECAEGTTCNYDELTIGVSTDGGQTFTQEAPLVTSGLSFTSTTVDLTVYANMNVVLDVMFNSGDANDNAYEGAYVDNLNLADGVVAHTVRTSTPSIVTTESGGTDTFEVVLNTAPTDDVTIGISSDNTAEALVMGGDSPTGYTDTISMTFTSVNWDVPQTVSVQGHSEYIRDGNVLYNVVLAPAVSLDTLYSGVDAADITAVNYDDGVVPTACDGATPLAVGDDASTVVPIGFSFGFQGVQYDYVHVGSNGYLTFGAGDTAYNESIAELLSQQPRIAALWHDLDGRTGAISCANNTADSMTVSFVGVSQLSKVNSNSFDITLNSDGSIIIDYGVVEALSALVGISDGLSLSTDPGEVDLSTNPAQSATGVVYELFDASDNDLSNTTLTFTPVP